MRIVVVGLGSMGKRRIRLLKENFKDTVIIGIDKEETRIREAQEKFGIPCRKSIEELNEKEQIDCAFVCTSPLSHAKIIKNCLENGWNVFSEINLTEDGYHENMALALAKKKVLFLSSTPLYREEMKAINDVVTKNNKPVRYIYHVGQYLPDWHPWERYQDFFVKNRKTSGCRELFEIELPWMIRTFGKIRNISSYSSKITELDIEYNDNYFVELEHESGSRGIFVVDVVSRQPVRRLEIFNEEIYIEWNGMPETLKYKNINRSKMEILKSGRYVNIDGYSEFVNEDAYLNEMQEFFEILSGNKKAIYNFEDDLTTLKLIDEIEGVV